MPRLSIEEVRDFLKTHLVVRIATLSEGGFPYVAPTGFVLDKDVVLLSPRGRAAWYQNIERDPRVGLSFDQEAPPNQRVIVHGVEATILYPPGREAEWLHIARRISSKAFGEAGADHYLAATGHISRALISVPLPYGERRLLSWRPEVKGDDLSGLWPSRYGKINPHAHTENSSDFAGWAPDDRDGEAR